jgi:hypothetical protein
MKNIQKPNSSSESFDTFEFSRYPDLRLVVCLPNSIMTDSDLKINNKHSPFDR